MYKRKEGRKEERKKKKLGLGWINPRFKESPLFTKSDSVQ
jgi:hypothetical protein